VINSSVQFHQFDPIDYVVFAKTLIEHGEYISLHRLPGYPMLLGMFFWVFGYHLSTVAVLQAIMFDIAVLTLALSLQPWLHPLLGAIAVFVAILSPIQVIHSVWTMSESTFATFAVFSIAALFNHLSTRGFTGKVWLIIYAISATFAFLIRPNGVVLFAALLPICLPRLLNLLYRSIGWRDKIKLFFYTVPYFMTVIVLLAAVLTWSARNYVYYNYFQLSILTGHVPLQKLLFPAIFDARGLLNLYCPIEKGCPNDLHRSLYNSFIINRYQYPHWDMTFFSMRPTIDQILPPVPGPTRQFQISQVLQAVGRKAQDLIPWQARTIGILRAGWAAFGWRNLKGAFNMTPADRATYRQRKELLHSTVSDKFVYDERGESRLVSLYTKIVSGYSWYMPLWLLALISGVLIVWRGQPALACPLFVFITNGLFYVYFLQTAEVRYIQILDTLLVFQCALGLTLLYSHNSRIRGRTL
jgi:4-amino-4-deoxy-L-arabinose transferase-like glycosyltransferase